MKTLIRLMFLVYIFKIDAQVITASNDDGEWWKSGVVWIQNSLSFKDSTNSGEGDLRGIIDKLDHLKELGVTGAWLNPIFKSPMKDGGYDIADFYNIDPRYGTNEQLYELFAKAKQLRLRIFLDLVPNHTSDMHEWFKKSAKREAGYEDYYVWVDCETKKDENGKTIITTYPNNWIAVFHTPAWSYNEERKQCYLHQFLAAQPDLNYRNEKVIKEMGDVLLYWLRKGVDGFRIDAINHMFETIGFPDEPYVDGNGDKTHYENLQHIHTRDLQESYDVIFKWRKLMDDYAAQHKTDNKFMMTEAYADINKQIKWYGTKEIPGSHMPFNFALILNLDAKSTAQDFQKAVNDWYSRLPSFGEANWVLGNHDRPRIGFRYGEERHESLVMMTMLLLEKFAITFPSAVTSLNGINFKLLGEEILMTDNRDITWEETDDPQAKQSNETVFQLYTRDPVRTPFQWDDTTHAGFSRAERTWLPVHKNFKEVNLKLQKSAKKSTFKFYQHLLKLRKEDIFKYGGFRSMAVNDQVFAFVRTAEKNDPVVVFINLGDETKLSIRGVLRDNEIPSDAYGKILAATHTSNYEIDQLLKPEDFILKKYDAIAIQVGSASKIRISLLATVLLVIVKVF